MPPPQTNFETLQDILAKRKGLSLDVSSSKALADSLDTCVVSTKASRHANVGSLISRNLGPWASRVQHLGQDHGNAMHARGRVLLLWQCVQGPIRALWIGDTHLYAFHCEYMHWFN